MGSTGSGTKSPPSAPLLGAQHPRILWVPPSVGGVGQEAVELAASAGLHLDPWQAFTLANSLNMRPDGAWAAFEVGLAVARQNGKGGILTARQIAGLYLLGERFLVHSAHQFDTSLEAFRRLLELIEDNDEFSRRIKKVSRSHGEEGIELTTGQRIRFRTRTKGGGRGFSGDWLGLDEAMDLPLSAHGALLPTLSARPNPQVWYTGSAVDQNVHEHGLVFARIRQRGMNGDDERLMYVEFSADADIDEAHEVLDDEAAWAQANPGLGIRITREFVEMERRSMDPRTFAVERLGVGDWPRLDDVDQDGITREMWGSCADEMSTVVDPVCFAFDVRPDRQKAAICVSGFREDGLKHVEVIEHRAGTKWVLGRLVDLTRQHECGPVILDEKSPAAALIPKLVDHDIEFEAVSGSEYSQGCGMFFDEVEQEGVRHLGTPELTAAALGAAKRPLGDAWAWSRKNSAVDISPLVASSLALWGLVNRTPEIPFVFEVIG
jgi:hypothetical protein